MRLQQDAGVRQSCAGRYRIVRKVGPRRESAADGGKDERAGARSGGVDGGVQLFEHVGRDRVQRAGVIESNHIDIADLLDLKLGTVHLRSSKLDRSGAEPGGCAFKWPRSWRHRPE